MKTIDTEGNPVDSVSAAGKKPGRRYVDSPQRAYTSAEFQVFGRMHRYRFKDEYIELADKIFELYHKDYHATSIFTALLYGATAIRRDSQ